jgi:hypothetical protein
MSRHHHQPDITGRFEIRPFSIGGLHVSEVTGSFSLNVKGPATPSLALNPTTGALPDESEGTTVNDDLVANVSGGTKPYTVGVTGLPAGVSAAELDQPDGSVNVVLEGAPAAGSASGSPYMVAVDVTDSTPAASASARRPLTVR